MKIAVTGGAGRIGREAVRELLAAIPSARIHPSSLVVQINVASHFNVLEAARILGIPRVASASSIQVITQVQAARPVWPSYFPVDELHPVLPANAYGVTKVVGESYVDIRDAAKACRLAVEAEGLGAEAFYITAADTLREEPTAELVARHFPNAEIRPGLEGHASCFDIAKARELLGYEPSYSWRT